MNIDIIQQRGFSGGVNDLMPPDLLGDAEFLRGVNMLPGDDGAPLPVRRGTTAYLNTGLGSSLVTGVFAYRRSGGGDQWLCAHGGTLYEVTPTTQNAIYTLDASGNDVECAFAVMNDTCYIATGTELVKWDGTGDASGNAQAVAGGPPNAAVLSVYRDRLFVGDGTSKVYFSGPLDDTSWSGAEPDDGGWLYVSRDDGSNVTALAALFNGLVVFKERDIYLWTYEEAANPGLEGSIAKLIPGIGCVAQGTVAYYAGALYFLGQSSEGNYALYRLQGQGLDDASIKVPQRLAAVLAGSPRRPMGIVHDHRYLLAVDTGSGERDTVYVLDLRRGGWSELAGWTVGGWDTDGGLLYIGGIGNIFTFPQGTADATDACGNPVPIAYAFESKPFTGHTALADKRWRNVWADLEGASSGAVRLGYSIDGGLPAFTTFDLTDPESWYYDSGVRYDSGARYAVGETTHSLSVPVVGGRGRALTVHIEGTTTAPLRIARIGVGFRRRSVKASDRA